MILLLLISCFIIRGSFNVSAATASMENQIYDGISNRQFILQYPNENYIIRECTFTNCFATGNGGALSIKVSNGASINIIDCTFTNCTSVANGGAIKLDISAGSTSTFEGLIQFINCSGLVGGAFWASIGSENSKLIINQMQIQDCSSSNIGGGMYLQSKLQAIVNIEQLTFKNCSSLSSGGGAYIITESQGYITINKITAEDCTCQKGNGGGIYVNIDFGASSQFKMINISLLRCKAQSDTSNDIPPTGYGGGIFLSGQGNYDSLTKVLDFRKMKFNGNTADKAGQTMYVAISKVVEWCKEGTLGEYVKGNYSDGTSSQNELQGIPDDLQTFNYYSSTQINELQNRLQYYWNVDRDEYYVRSNGSDQQPCNSSNPCLTVEESQINLNINSLKPFLLYIYDSTSISNNVIISQFHTPRTFRNYPLDSIQLSTILIQATGGFYVSGKVRFQLINFIMEGTQQYGTHGISGLSDASEIDIKDCQFHMQNAGSQIGKCLVYASIGGNHAISNLIAKDISSYENIIKILFYYAGSVIITDCQFENITKIGETIAGGATLAILQSHQNRFDIIDCKFTSCKAPYTTGGAVYAEIVSASALIAITRTIFKQCEALNGGGLYSRIHIQGNVIIDHSCEFKQCKAIQGNGGGIYSEIYPQESTYISFHINDALIQDCQALTSSNPESTGYGGGIFIGVEGNYNPSTQKLNLKGMKIYGNSASKAGQSLYAVMSELKDWCEYGLFGVNVKGNFSEIDSNQNDLQGLPIDFSQFASIEQSYIQTNQKTLLNYWVLQLPTNQIWHITQRDSDTSLGNDIRSCGEVSLPCKTIEYTIQEISLNKGGLPTVFIEEKNIGIRLNGYDLMDPLQLSKSGSYSNVIKIMKQMYGTSSEIPENSEIKIVKNNDNNKENGKVGWISVFEGLQLHLYGLNIIMDNSQLTIPIIYVQDSDSLLDLISIGFSRIILSPMTEAKGIIHINVDNSQFNALYCSFKNIDISSKGGNAIRILNSGSYPIKATIKGCQFNSINSIGDSNGRGGSAIYMESKHGSKLIIDESCQFQKCLIDNGNGGAIYISIDFTSQFEFKINNALIQECEAKADTIQTSPTGYGGGIFLTGSGDYYPSTQRLDLKGMKIFNNIADKGGQSLYVAMTKIKDWCQTGILGEYVKGNYNDKYSNFEDIEGISVNLTIFNSLSLEQIQRQQYTLQYYWIEISNLTKVSAILNISDTNQPLLINLEGQNMIAGQLTVKIVELGQIRKMNKLNERQTSINYNSKKQLQFNILSKSSSSILAIANTNLYNNNTLKLVGNDDFEIIYPPDGSIEDINIEGDPQNQQTSQFELNQYDWFDYDNKYYGVFVSNDRRIFTGIDGKLVQAYPLEVIIEKDDVGKTAHFPWWIILIIVLSSIILIIIIIILICCICFCWRKYKDEKNIKINYFSDINYQNSRNQTEMKTQDEEFAYDYASQNKQIQLSQYNYNNIKINKEPLKYPIQSVNNMPRELQSETFQYKSSARYKTPQQTQTIKPIQYLCFSDLHAYVSQSQQQNNALDQSQYRSTSYMHQVPKEYSTLTQSENNQINQSLARSTSGYLPVIATEENIYKQLQHSQSLSPFQFHEPYPQQIDPSLRWQQQIQISDSSKDQDLPLKKDPPVYSEIKQSHNITDDEEQIIINWNSFKKNDIPPFKYKNKKK